MNRKEAKQFVETLHFHGYIAHDITKLDSLIDDYYPKSSDTNNTNNGFMCAHGAENKCKEQCLTCSEDEKCDVKYSYKATMTHYFQFTEWIAERYNYIGGEWCCWCAKQYDIKDTQRYKDTGELWAYWRENCR